jgi:1-acyl-sn-glycerol-3-phosphate acyltransferase
VIDDVRGTLLALRAMYETLEISAPTVAEALVSRVTREKCDVRLERWSRRLLAQAEVDLTVSGREHIVPGKPYVVMSNHASHYDVPILFQAFPGTLRMVAKTELFRIPIFGGALTAAGFVEIDRSNSKRAIASLNAAREHLAKGVSIWIAPEGTRSRTGELGRFKKGGFMLAIDAELPVLPVGIAGSRDVLAAHGRVVRRGARVHVTFRPPVEHPRGENGAAARDALMASVHDEIVRALEDARAHVAGAR